jgi:drug/metabolite transporter (DMT)-like permease
MEKIKTIHSAGSWKFTLSGSFVGTYLALIVWLAGMKYTEASVSSVLNQTSQIFIFILATIFLKEKITIRKALGISLAFAGIFLATFG